MHTGSRYRARIPTELLISGQAPNITKVHLSILAAHYSAGVRSFDSRHLQIPVERGSRQKEEDEELLEFDEPEEEEAPESESEEEVPEEPEEEPEIREPTALDLEFEDDPDTSLYPDVEIPAGSEKPEPKIESELKPEPEIPEVVVLTPQHVPEPVTEPDNRLNSWPCTHTVHLTRQSVNPAMIALVESTRITGYTRPVRTMGPEGHAVRQFLLDLLFLQLVRGGKSLDAFRASRLMPHFPHQFQQRLFVLAWLARRGYVDCSTTEVDRTSMIFVPEGCCVFLFRTGTTQPTELDTLLDRAFLKANDLAIKCPEQGMQKLLTILHEADAPYAAEPKQKIQEGLS